MKRTLMQIRLYRGPFLFKIQIMEILTKTCDNDRLGK